MADPTSDTCPPHTPAPVGYIAWHDWAEDMSKTHTQERCPGCGLLMIWVPKDDTTPGTAGETP